MSITQFHHFFFPSSVAILGAQDTPGRKILANLLSGGFNGRIYPISQTRQQLAGLPSYPNLKSIAESVDLAILAVAFNTLPAALDACGRAGIRAAVVPSRNSRSQEMSEKILKQAHTSGVRIIGPRSWGVVSPTVGLNAGLGQPLPPPGKLAVISQSAAICAGILNLSLSKQIGLSFLVGLGDMLDIDCADMLDYMANHHAAGAILIHVEHLLNMRKFMSAARAVSRIKPVIVFKTGRRQFEEVTAATPTGGLIRVDAVYGAAFKRAGIIRVDSVEDLFDCGDLASKQPRPRGSNLAVISNARSPGVMAEDFLIQRGLQPAGLTSETVTALDRILFSAWNRQNPITMRAELSAEAYCQVIKICLSAPEINGILIIITPQFLSDPTAVARAITSAVSVSTTPVVAVWMGGEGMDTARQFLDEAGIPAYDAPERAIRAFLHLYEYDHNLRLLQEIPRLKAIRFATNRAVAREIIDSALHQKTPTLTPLESLNLLKVYDLPTVPAEFARSPEEALRFADKWGYPITLKPLSRDITKTMPAEKGAESLGGPEEVTAAFEQFMQVAGDENLNGEPFVVMVQRVINRPDLALRLGSRLVSPLGPVMVFGSGGGTAEICTDYAIGLPPLNRMLAGRILQETQIYTILKDHGSLQPDCRPALEELLVHFSHLITDFPEISEIEINPLLIVGGRVFASNARSIIQTAKTPSLMHLIISAYPDEYETATVTKSGLSIFIRPIKPEDASLLQDLWSTLSQRTIYYRFSRPIKELTPELLIRFTQIDYDREIALIALQTAGSRDRMLGVARLIRQPGTNAAEFAIVVGDPWQGLGVGAKLLSCLAAIAIKQKIRTLWGLVLRENRAIIELCKKLGWTMEPDDDPSQVFLRLDLSTVDAPEILEAFGKNL